MVWSGKQHHWCFDNTARFERKEWYTCITSLQGPSLEVFHIRAPQVKSLANVRPFTQLWIRIMGLCHVTSKQAQPRLSNDSDLVCVSVCVCESPLIRISTQRSRQTEESIVIGTHTRSPLHHYSNKKCKCVCFHKSEYNSISEASCPPTACHFMRSRTCV